MISIKAVVLAAGASSRMGKFKPLLPIDGTPMLEIVLEKVLSFPFKEVITVVGYKEKEIRAAINVQDPRFKWVINEHFQEGLSSSIKAAIPQYDKPTYGIMVFLGDQPLLKKSTIHQVLQGIMTSGFCQSKCIIQPTFNGTPGHPVFISAEMLPYLHTITGDQGAKPIFKYADKHIHIPINDHGTIIDVDTPQDYQNIVHPPYNDV